MTTIVRSKENDCDLSLFKTPRRAPMLTPIRNHMLSSATLTDLVSQLCNDSMISPIRIDSFKLSTAGSTQRRRALGLVNSNNHVRLAPFSDNTSLPMNLKYDEPIDFDAAEDDLPHRSNNHRAYEDAFDDLIPANERIEHVLLTQTNGVNLFAISNNIDNTIRCQSPRDARIDISSLLDMLD